MTERTLSSSTLHSGLGAGQRTDSLELLGGFVKPEWQTAEQPRRPPYDAAAAAAAAAEREREEQGQAQREEGRQDRAQRQLVDSSTRPHEAAAEAEAEAAAVRQSRQPMGRREQAEEAAAEVVGRLKGQKEAAAAATTTTAAAAATTLTRGARAAAARRKQSAAMEQQMDAALAYTVQTLVGNLSSALCRQWQYSALFMGQLLASVVQLGCEHRELPELRRIATLTVGLVESLQSDLETEGPGNGGAVCLETHSGWYAAVVEEMVGMQTAWLRRERRAEAEVRAERRRVQLRTLLGDSVDVSALLSRRLGGGSLQATRAALHSHLQAAFGAHHQLAALNLHGGGDQTEALRAAAGELKRLAQALCAPHLVECVEVLQRAVVQCVSVHTLAEHSEDVERSVL